MSHIPMMPVSIHPNPNEWQQKLADENIILDKGLSYWA